MSASAELPPIAGADGASIGLSIEVATLHVHYQAPEIEKPDHQIFLVLKSDPRGGSAVVPFEQNREGSTVFLPFSANRIYSASASQEGATKTSRIWQKTEWSAAADEKTAFMAEFSANQCDLAIDLAELGNPASLGFVLYAKAQRENNGWGKFYACSDASVRAGIGDKYIPSFFEISLGENPALTRRVRRNVEQRIHIYQLLVRLFGNTNETRKINGTLAENGVGKFADINDAALAAIADMGFTHVWLTGVLQQATATDYSSIGAPADDPDLLKGLAGSPYAIKDCFDVCPDYAVDPAKRLDEFKALLARVHAHGLKALIDLVPNHVARSYGSDVMPGVSFGVKDDTTKFFDPENDFFYLRPNDPGGGPPLKLPTCKDGQAISPTCQVLGNKCDGLFDAEKTLGRVTGNDVVSWTPHLTDWYETVKLNYGVDFTNPSHREFPHGATLDKPIPSTWRKVDRIIEYWQTFGVDGFRCDMAHMVPPEFWHWALARARMRQPGVFFMAEAYDADPAKIYGSNPVLVSLNDGRGNVMFDLLDAGFDAVYDDPTYKTIKAIYDGSAWANDIDRALGADFIFQNSLRYCENHDEVRLAGKDQWGRIGMEVGRPAAGILYGIGRGPVMLYHGQEIGEPANGTSGFGGDNARTTIFDYWSMPEFVKWVNGHKYDGAHLSAPQKDLRLFYKRLITLVGEPAFRDGGFFGLNSANTRSAHFGAVEGDPVSGHWMYAFLRYDMRSGQRFLVLVNLHRSLPFQNLHVHFSREALDWLALPDDANLHFNERLNGKISLTAKAGDLATVGLIVPIIPPLTPMYFEIKSP